jgi:hypothetical protein
LCGQFRVGYDDAVTSASVESSRSSPRESDFWALCEFVLDRLDGMVDSATVELVAAERALVARMMVREAVTPAAPDALAVVIDVLKSLAQPYRGHREFRPSWRLDDVPRLPGQRTDAAVESRRASRNRGSQGGSSPSQSP